MNKEELIRNLKYTEKKHRNDAVNTFGTDISKMCSDVLIVLENCIEIPEGATNGDMIKAMFPDAQIDYHEESDLVDSHVTVFLKDCDTCQDYSIDWWNAPYREVEE